MNINRYNYEEYFILYVDNELDAGGKLEVEAFAEQNPDLKSELDMLMQSKLIPDDKINFSDKGSLMRFQDSSVTLANYEEWLIAYIDDELSPAEKEDAEKFIAGNPSIQRELNLLQRAKLQPEIIEFPGKESLYRKEEKARTIIVTWRRMAAAAVLLLGISTTAIFLMNKNRETNADKGTIASNPSNGQRSPVTTSEVKTNIPPASPGNPKQGDEVNRLDHKTQTEPSLNTGSRSNGNVVKNSDKNKERAEPTQSGKEEIATVNHPQADISKANTGTTGNSSSQIPEDKTIPSNMASTNGGADKGTDGTLTNRSPKAIDGPVTEGTAGSLNNPKADNPDITFASEKSGGGLRGFFRKVTRNIEKRTNIKATDDDDRLLIAGLAIKMN